MQIENSPASIFYFLFSIRYSYVRLLTSAATIRKIT